MQGRVTLFPAESHSNFLLLREALGGCRAPPWALFLLQIPPLLSPPRRYLEDVRFPIAEEAEKSSPICGIISELLVGKFLLGNFEQSLLNTSYSYLGCSYIQSDGSLKSFCV